MCMTLADAGTNSGGNVNWFDEVVAEVCAKPGGGHVSALAEVRIPAFQVRFLVLPQTAPTPLHPTAALRPHITYSTPHMGDGRA